MGEVSIKVECDVDMECDSDPAEVKEELTEEKYLFMIKEGR